MIFNYLPKTKSVKLSKIGFNDDENPSEAVHPIIRQDTVYVHMWEIESSP